MQAIIKTQNLHHGLNKLPETPGKHVFDKLLPVVFQTPPKTYQWLQVV
jgi:hypothetical protein